MNRFVLFVLSLLLHFASQGQAISRSFPNTQHSLSTQMWDEQEAPVNGYSRVLSQGKFSFLNAGGKLICTASFDDARNFNHGLAAVKKGEQWGFIDKNGKVVIPCLYEIVYDFAENVTGALLNHKWLLIDVNGIKISQLDVDKFYGFVGGTAKVIKGTRVGSCDLTGSVNYTSEIPAIAERQLHPASLITSNCPNNIDFENGDFTNWNCFVGHADSVGLTNIINVLPSQPLPNRHKIISRSIPTLYDPYGLFSTNPPDGSNFAVKLGNTRIGGEAERIQYVVHIPANDSNFSIRYDYAVVFQDPGHTSWTQPRFTAKLFDSAANAYIDCASFEYIATSNLPGFQISALDSSVIYKPWASAFISLRGHAGQTLYLEFTTADCVRKGHWGYAYLDVESVCSHAIDVDLDCATGIANLVAPPGFQAYNWWNQDYTAILGTGEQVALNPAPPINSTVWLEMVPFSDFGCKDTIPAHISGSFNPHFDVSEHVGNCAPHSFSFYNTTLPSTAVTWNFGDGSTGSGDTITHTYTNAGNYIVTMHVTLPSGCNGIFLDSITVLETSGNLMYTAGSFCGEKLVTFNATVFNADSIRWNFGDGTIVSNNQATMVHTYSAAGIYVPTITLLSGAGCTAMLTGDTINIERLQAGFSYVENKTCAATVVTFTDTSRSVFGVQETRWDFGDGTFASGAIATHIFSAGGIYTVKMLVVGATGCVDSIVQVINVVVYSNPVATISGPATACLNAPVLFTGITQSTDPITALTWTATNGASATGNNFEINFTEPGDYAIGVAVITAYGCTDTAIHLITINPAATIQQPLDMRVCNGLTVSIPVFEGLPANVVYQWVNDNPAIGLPVNGSGNLPLFTAANPTSTEITATITVTATTAGCAGEAKAFTITVLPTPFVNTPSDQVVCNRAMTEAIIFNSFARSVNNMDFIWTNNAPSIGLAANGAGNIPAFSAINAGVTPITATITLTISNNGCIAAPATFTITINPTPEVPLPGNQQLCNGAVSVTQYFTSSLPATTYTWTNDQAGMGLAASGEDSIAAFTAINNSNVPITANIVLTATAHGCSADPIAYSIAVNPTPDVLQPGNQSLCTGQQTNAIIFSGSVTRHQLQLAE